MQEVHPHISKEKNTFFLNGVSVQSMTNTNTLNVKKTIHQVNELINCGCREIRISTPGMSDVKAFSRIVEHFSIYSNRPFFIADVHFNFKVALGVAQYADRIRINPGNFISEKEMQLDEDLRNNLLSDRIQELSEVCRNFKTSIRIGVNQGSVYKEGRVMDNAEDLVEVLLDYVRIFRSNNFHNLILSIKSSDPWMVIESNSLLKHRMELLGMNYPIHLGVTEAGNGLSGRIKSALGIGQCLMNGIGDTIRVSLAETPANEIPVAKEIIEKSRTLKSLHQAIKKFSGGKNLFDFPFLVNQSENPNSKVWMGDYVVDSLKDLPFECQCVKFDEMLSSDLDSFKNYDLPILVNVNFTSKNLLESALILPLLIRNKIIQGLILDSSSANNEYELEVAKEILQIGSGRILKSDIIACPSCSRTNFDLEKLVDSIRANFSEANRKISVMGCGVNGYGEMKKADIGIIGSGKGKVDIYVKERKVKSAIQIGNVIDELQEYMVI